MNLVNAAQQKNTLHVYLTYAGALPFIICSTFLSVGISTIPLLGSIEQILTAYSLIITSFMAGSHWGQQFYLYGGWKLYLPILSNIIAVTVWLCFLTLPFKMLIPAFIIAFVVLLVTDYKLFQSDVITCRYFQTRCYVTAIVIISLIISGIMS